MKKSCHSFSVPRNIVILVNMGFLVEKHFLAFKDAISLSSGFFVSSESALSFSVAPSKVIGIVSFFSVKNASLFWILNSVKLLVLHA